MDELSFVLIKNILKERNESAKKIQKYWISKI
jgi:hypothetical protein